MTTVLRFSGPDGAQELTAAKLPIAVGVNDQGAFVFGDEVEGHPSLWFAQADGALFIQSAADSEGVKLNQQALHESAWLADGDEISLGPATIDIRFERGVFVLSPRLVNRGPALVVPTSARPEAQADGGVLTKAHCAAVAEAMPALATESTPGTNASGASNTEAAAHAEANSAQSADDPCAAAPTTAPAATAINPMGVAVSDADPLLPRPPRAGRHSRRRRAAALLLLGSLALGVLLTLLARPLEITVEPMPDRLSIEGLLPPFKYTERYLALPGAYRLKAYKTGYHDLDTGFAIEYGEQPVLSYKLKKLPGRLSVTTHPVEHAQVLLDGTPAGRTPLDDVEIEAGTHTLQLIADRYQTLQVVLEIEGMGRSQRLNAQLIPGWGRVRVESAPPGATVSIDGAAAGLTPIMLEPMAGSYRLGLRKEGWRDIAQPIEIEANRETELPPFVLEKAPGQLSLSSTPNAATVLVDGKFHGPTPLRLELLADSEHTIVLSKPGYVRASRKIRLAAAEATELNVELEAEYGVVFISSRPADARLSIDGKAAGSASQRLRLRTRPHRFEIAKPGYETVAKTLTPSAQLSKSIEVQLQRIEQSPTNGTSKAPLTPSGHKLLEFAIDKPALFVMGASRREQGRRANETLHSVALTRSFRLADKEVSNAQYRRFKPGHDSGQVFGLDLDADEQAVVNVSWDDAARYLNWLSRAEGLPAAYREDNGRMIAVKPMNEGYRFPSEAEWVYAARYEGGQRAADNALKYPWGDTWPPRSKAGNFADSAAAAHLQLTIPGYSDGHIVTAPPASSAANAAGIYDLGGNVSEWCHDYYDVYTGDESAVARDPTGPPSGQNHSVRGASWRHGSITELRLSFRDYGRDGRNDLGIRVARYVRASGN